MNPRLLLILAAIGLSVTLALWLKDRSTGSGGVNHQSLIPCNHRPKLQTEFYDPEEELHRPRLGP